MHDCLPSAWIAYEFVAVVSGFVWFCMWLCMGWVVVLCGFVWIAYGSVNVNVNVNVMDFVWFCMESCGCVWIRIDLRMEFVWIVCVWICCGFF